MILVVRVFDFCLVWIVGEGAEVEVGIRLNF